MSNSSKQVFLNCDSDLIRQELDTSSSEEISADDTDEDPDFTPDECFSKLLKGHTFLKTIKQQQTTGQTILGLGLHLIPSLRFLIIMLAYLKLSMHLEQVQM